MLAYLRRHYMGVIALFVALGGISYAATRLPVPPPAATWRDPEILAEIGASGQKIVDQKIVTVEVTAPWVPTGLSITAGQRLWTDTRTDGRWNGNPRLFPFSDANGLGPSVYKNCWKIDENAQVESLIGFIGGSPVNVTEGCRGGTTDPGFFEAGDTLRNYTPRTTGPIWLRTNDNTNHISNVGQQNVKVIIASP